MAKKLNSYVHVHGHGIYGPEDKLPAEVRKLLADNPQCWAEDDGAEEELAETHPGPSETAAAGEQVEAAVEAAQEQRDAEHQAAVEAAGLGDEAKPAARSTRARSSRK